MAVNFERYIDERTADFSPRPWLFDRIAAWLLQPSSRYLLITAEPGAGKTAVAAQVVLASRGTVAQPLPIPAGAIAAHHFCSAKDAGWIDPLAFCHSISAQLAAAVPGFDRALIEANPAVGPLTATGHVHVERPTRDAFVAGLVLNLQTVSAPTAFNAEVRAPLEWLYGQGLDRDVIILVDALDEARLAGQTDTIFDLIAQVAQWPPRVRFLVTTRPEQPIVRRLQGDDPAILTIALSSGDERERSCHDVRRYIGDRTPRFLDKLAPDFSSAALGDQLAAKADGNFLWGVFAMSMLDSAAPPITPDTLAALPEGLSPLYLQFIERLARRDRDRWFAAHAHILGLLVVAQEAMREEELAACSGLSLTETTRVIQDDLAQLLDKTETDGYRNWSIYHRSLTNFLLDRAEAREYHCEQPVYHRRVADAWLGAVGPASPRDWTRSDGYARRNIAAHLFALRGDDAMRAHLHALVSRGWMEAKGDDVSFARDVALAAEAAAERHPQALLDQMRATAVLTALYSRAQAAPAGLLALMARLGDLEGALSYLALSGDAETKALSAVTVADMLIETDPHAAERILDDVSGMAGSKQSVRAAELKARIFASTGRFDDLVPLIPAIAGEWGVVLEITRAAAQAGRYAIAEAMIARCRDAHGQERLAAELITGALARRDHEVACRVALSDPSAHRDKLVLVARAFRASDPARAARIVATLAAEWPRTLGFAALASDAVLESDAALEALLAHLPAADTPAILEQVVKSALDCERDDLATRLAGRAGEKALALVQSARLVKMMKGGQIAEALAMASGQSGAGESVWDRLAEVAVAHGTADQTAVTLSHVASGSWQFGHVLTMAVRDRERPAFVLAVLQRLGETGRVTDKTRTDVATDLVKHRCAEAALGLVDAAPEPGRQALVESIVRTALDENLLDDARRGLTRLPGNTAFWLRVDLVERLIDAARFDEARAVAGGPRAMAGTRLMTWLIDGLADAGRIAEALKIARESGEAEALVERVLVRRPSVDVLAAMPELRGVIGQMVERAARVLACQGSSDDALALHVRYARSSAAAAAASPASSSATATAAAAAAGGKTPISQWAHDPALASEADAAYRASLPADDAIARLVSMRQWEVAFQLAQGAGDLYQQQRDLRWLLDAAAWEHQLAAAVAAGRAIGAPHIDETLARFAERRSRFGLRIQASVLVTQDSYEQHRLVRDLIDAGQFARAAVAAGDDDHLLATVLSASVIAGAPLDIATLPAIPDSERERAIATAAQQLIAAGRHQEAHDYALHLRERFWQRPTIAQDLARGGRIDLALDLARSGSAYDRDEIRVAVATAVAATDYDEASRILRLVVEPRARANGVVAVITALLEGSQVEPALAMMRESRLLPHSVDALTQVATALLKAGQREAARTAVDTALRLVSSVTDSWSRNACLSDLVRSLIRRSQFEGACKVAAMIPAASLFQAAVAEDIAVWRTQAGDAATAIRDVTAQIDVWRRSEQRDAFRLEGRLSGLLACLRGLHTVPEICGAIATAPQRSNRSAVPFILVALTQRLHWRNVRPPAHRLLDRARQWLWHRRADRWSAWLLDRASAIAAGDTNEHMRLQALAVIAMRHADLGRRRQALARANAAEEAVGWPPSWAKVQVLSRLGLIHQQAGDAARAGDLLRAVIETVLSLDDSPDFEAFEIAGRLVAVRKAPAEAIERLLSVATQQDTSVVWRPLWVLRHAADNDAVSAARIGQALVRAAAGAPPAAAGVLCGAVFHCAVRAQDDALLDAAWTLVQRLDPQQARAMLPDAANAAVAGGLAAARRWVDAAALAVEQQTDAASAPGLRVSLARAFWRLGARDEAFHQMAAALDEVRHVSRDAFFDVLRGWLDVLEDDPRLLDVAAIVLETELWWKHRQESDDGP